MIPNQIGSKPSARMMGNTTGMVITSIAKASINRPSRKYISKMASSTRTDCKPSNPSG